MCIAATLVTGSSAIAARFYDLSSDGQEYHQTAVLKLAEGWIPNRQMIAARDSVHHRWLNHYPKAGWYVAAASMKAGAGIEQAKAWNFLLAVAAGLVTYASLAAWMPRTKAALLAGLVSVNAVTVCQLLSYYQDGQVASLWSALVALSLLWVQAPAWPVAVPLLGCMGYLAGLKYTGLLFDGVLSACILAALLIRGEKILARWWSLIASVALLNAALVLGFNPYVTNTVRQGNPFYLLIGRDAYHYVSNRGPNQCCVPPGFQDIDRFRGLLISLFSRSENNSGYAPPRWKLPFAVNSGELREFYYPDIRLGGWGPLMGGGMILAAVALIRSRPRAWRHRVSWDVVLLCAITCVALPYPWWARYAPMVGLLPVVALGHLWTGVLRTADRILAGLLATTLVTNIGLVAYGHFRGQVAEGRLLDEQLRTLAGMTAPLLVRINETESMRYRLRAAGIEFRETMQLPCDPRKIVSSETEFCLPGDRGGRQAR